MSQLIHMKHRIKAVGVTKKLTHAMRVIAMSMHARVKDRRTFMKRYRSSITGMFLRIKQQFPAWKDPLFDPERSVTADVLLIVAGSQKGLCGAFNLNVFQLLTRTLEKLHTQQQQVRLVAVGRKVADLTRALYPNLLYATYEPFTTTTFAALAAQLVQDILSNNYATVMVVSTEPVSFFTHKPHVTTITPLAVDMLSQSQEDSDEADRPISLEYVLEQPSQEVLDALVQRFITAQLEQVLLDSLTAEHASRFVAMDASTRNASTMLEEMELQYNKMRQGKITKELTELVGGFLP